MGNAINGPKKIPKLSHKEIAMFEKDTFLTSHEILNLHQAYRQYSNIDGCVDKDKFAEIFSNFNRSAKALLFLDHIFRTWDEDKDGNLSFKEFIHAMSATSRGTTQQRSEYLFHLYDINDDGEITIEEFSYVLRLRLRKLELLDLEDIFKKMDTNGNGTLSKEEFVTACTTNTAIMEYLDIY